MSFDDMPDLGQMSLPEGSAYAAWAIEQSKLVAKQARIVWDLPYGSDFYQKLDLFLPNDPKAADVPVLIFLHGGAWRHGFKEWNGFMAPHITGLPGIMVSANYRLAPGAKYPKPLEDVIDIIAWVYRNIRRYGGDNRRTFIGGHSAGGHLAALAALKPILLLAHLVPKDAIKACFPLSAPLDLRLEMCEPGGRRERLIKNFLDRDDQDRDASATESVAGNTTPFFLAWGENDLPELLEHNKRMVELMKKENCVFEHYLYKGCGHFDTHRDCIKPDSVWIKKVREWMTRTPVFA